MSKIARFWSPVKHGASTFRGKKIVDLKHNELLGVVAYLMGSAERDHNNIAHERAMLGALRKRL